MNLTPDEAKRSWCPFSRVRWHDDGMFMSFNRREDGSFPDGSKCLVTKCVMWTWTDEKKRFGYCSMCNK